MTSLTSMLRVRVDDRLKAQVAEALVVAGLALSDAVRMLLTRTAIECGLPAGLAVRPDAHDAWVWAKMRDALDDPRTSIPHADGMVDMRRMIAHDPRAVP